MGKKLYRSRLETPLDGKALKFLTSLKEDFKIIFKIRNNFAVSKGSGYTVEIDHNLKVDSRECKEIEDICIQYQLNIE